MATTKQHSSKKKKDGIKPAKITHTSKASATVSTESAGAPRSKRRQIVNAATKVFLKHGFEGTSVSKVAEEAGVIKATIYSHFADKRALFQAIMESLTVEKAVFEMEIEAKQIKPQLFFKALAEKFMDSAGDAQFRALIRVIIGESGRFPELSQLFYETVSCRGNRLIASYIKSHPELRMDDAEAAAQIITGSLVYWMLSQEVMGGKHIAPIDPTRIVDALERLFLSRVKNKSK